MTIRIDAVAAGAPSRLLPVESIPAQRQAQEEHAGLAREQAPAASFTTRPDPGVNAYAKPADAMGEHSAFVPLDPVAPALAQALAAEPWGHPMPHKAVWDQVEAARTKPDRVEDRSPVVAATPAAPATPATSAATATPEPTPVVSTAAAPATPAAATAAPVSPAWLTSLLKAR
jgi:hypothetical protein